MADPTPSPVSPQDVSNAERYFDVLKKAGAEADVIYAQYNKAFRLIVELEAIEYAKKNSVYEALYGQMERAAQVPRQLAAEITNSSVLASDGISATSKAFTDALYKDQEFLSRETVTTFKKVNEITGETIKEVKPQLAMFFKDAKELGQAFFDSAVSETRLYMAAIRDAAEEDGSRMREIAALTSKGLGVDVTTLRALYQEEFSKTGKVTGEFVEKFSATIMAASDATGLSSKQIAFDLSKATADVEKFGNSTYSQIASLSVPIRKLGLDMEDVSNVVGKFMKFEDATQAVSNFAAVTGASLDTMELFYKANSGDKLDFFRSLKQQLMDQGVAIENLTHQEQVYLAKGMGLNLRQFQSFMREDADITSEMLDEMIEENAEKAEYTGKDLADKLAQTGGLAAATLDALKPENIKQFAEVVRALSGGTSDFADATNQFGINLLSLTQDALPQFGEAGAKMSSQFVTGIGAMQQKWDDFTKKVEGAMGTSGDGRDGAFLALMKELERLFGPRSVPLAWQPLTKGLEFTSDAMMSILKTMNKGATKEFDEMRKGIVESSTKALEVSGKSFEDLLSKNAADKEKITAAMEKAKTSDESLLKDISKLGDQITQLKTSSYSDKAIQEMLTKDYGEKGFGTLTAAEFKSIITAKDQEFAALLPKMLKERNDKIYAELEGAKPAAPTTPAIPAPAGSGPAVPGATQPAGTQPAAPAQATGPVPEMTIKLALEFVSQELDKLIDVRIINGASRGIEVPLNTQGISGSGTMKINLVQ
jgi:uncharacterized protein YlbG (UPF0298 family)